MEDSDLTSRSAQGGEDSHASGGVGVWLAVDDDHHKVLIDPVAGSTNVEALTEAIEVMQKALSALERLAHA